MEGKALETRLVEFEKLGSLSSDDNDGNENCKKGIGLDDAPASPFFVHLFCLHSTTRRKNAYFHKTLFLFLNYDSVLKN